MKKPSIICAFALALCLMAGPAFPLSFEFDFNDNRDWDDELTLQPAEAVQVEIWLDGYSCWSYYEDRCATNELFGVSLYFQYDPTKIVVNHNEIIPNAGEDSGTFESCFCVVNGCAGVGGGVCGGQYLNPCVGGVCELEVCRFDCVSLDLEDEILLFTIELEAIDLGNTMISAAVDVGFPYNNGILFNCNIWEQSPDPAYADVSIEELQCQSDINCSGVVDLEDLGIMKEEFFNTPCILTPPKCTPGDTGDCCCQADINNSGTVDLEDLGIMKIEFFNEPCPPCTPPCTF